MENIFNSNNLRKLKFECKQLQLKENRHWVLFLIDYIISLIRYGVTLKQYTLTDFHKLKHFRRKKCLTYYKWEKLFPKLNKTSHIHFLENKVDFNTYFSDFVKRKWIFSKNMTFEDFKRLYLNHKNLIIKPIDLLEGNGVYRIVYNENTDIDKLYSELNNKSVLIEECIKQHNDMVFGNTSVNTIRVMTITDTQGKAHIFRTVLRAGVGDSVVDNYCAGGCIYNIDIETGLVDSRGFNKHLTNPIYHPGTDICMLGYQIPLWENVKKTVISAAEKLPECRFIGWDVAITENDIELIEGNHNPDYELAEFLGYTGSLGDIKQYI